MSKNDAWTQDIQMGLLSVQLTLDDSYRIDIRATGESNEEKIVISRKFDTRGKAVEWLEQNANRLSGAVAVALSLPHLSGIVRVITDFAGHIRGGTPEQYREQVMKSLDIKVTSPHSKTVLRAPFTILR